MVKNQFFKQKVKYNNHLERFSAIFLVVALCFLMSISVVSAMEWDNVKTYDEINKKATITNVFGFGETLAEITLTKNTYSCGTNCYAEGETTLYYQRQLIEGLRFKKLINSNWEVDTINSYKVYINKSEKLNKWKDVNGTNLERTDITWEEYDGSILEAGTYKWRIEGTKELYDTVDWLGTFFGKEIDEWAVWTGASNMSFRFEGNLLDENEIYNWTNKSARPFVTGKVGNAIVIHNEGTVVDRIENGTFSQDSNWTYAFWIKPQHTWNSSIGRIDMINEVNNQILIAYDRVDGRLDVYPVELSYAINFTSDVWQHIAISFNGTHTNMYVNGSLLNSTTGVLMTNPTTQIQFMSNGVTAGNFTLDELKYWKDFKTTSEILDIYDTENSPLGVTQLLPANHAKQMSTTMLFNISATYATNLKNITLFINGIWNASEDVTGLTNSSYFTVINNPRGNNNWTARACSATACTNSGYRYFNITDYTVNSQSYVASTVEGAINPFVLNVSYSTSTWNVASASLWYNGTQYPGTKTTYNSDTIFTSNVAAPNVNVVTNVSFYWMLGLTNSSTTIYNNLTMYNQSVSIINMSIFGSPYTIPFLNFTLYDETTLTELNGSISLTFNYRQSDATVTNSFSYSDITNTNSNFTFAISPADETYIIDSVLEYYAPGYAHKFYNFQGIEFTNTTTHIGLYLLNESSSTSFVVEVKDSSYQPLVGVEVYVQKYDVGTGMWFTSEIAETDSEGKTIQHFYTEDNLYRFKIYDDGVLLYTSPSKIIACPSTPCTVTIIISEAFINPLIPFQNLGSLDSTLTYSKATNIVTYTYSDTSGNFTQGRLYVIRSNPGEPNILFTCNETSSSSTAVLTCDLSAETNGTYIATGYITRGSTEKMVERNIFNKIRSIVTGIGVDGVLWSIFFLIGIIMLGVYRPSLGIIFGIVGVILLWSLQLMEITITALVALIGIAIILLLEVRKE